MAPISGFNSLLQAAKQAGSKSGSVIALFNGCCSSAGFWFSLILVSVTVIMCFLIKGKLTC